MSSRRGSPETPFGRSITATHSLIAAGLGLVAAFGTFSAVLTSRLIASPAPEVAFLRAIATDSAALVLILLAGIAGLAAVAVGSSYAFVVAALVIGNNPLVTYANLTVSAPSYLILTAVAIGGVIAAIAKRAAVRDSEGPRSPLDLPVAAMLVWTVVTAAVGLTRGNPASYVLSDSIQLGQFVAIYALGRATPRIAERAVPMIVALALITMIFELSAFASGRTGLSAIVVEGEVLPRGIDYVAGLVVPITLAYFIWARGWPLKLFWAGALLMSLAATLVGFTRGIWLGVAAAALVVIWLARRARERPSLRVVSMLLVAISVTALVIPVFHGRTAAQLIAGRLSYTVEQFTAPSTADQTIRQDEAAAVVEAIAESPVFGWGQGALYDAPGTVHANLGMKHYVHSLPLQFLLRSGAVGLALLVWLVAVTFRVSRWHLVDGTHGQVVAVAVFGALVSLAVMSLSISTLFRHPYTAYSGVLLAALATVTAAPRRHASTTA